MTKTAREILDAHAIWYVRRTIEMLKKGEEPQFVTGTNEQDKTALKEIEAVIEATYDNLPSLDKLTVGNEMSDGYDQGVEAFRQAAIKAIYGKESS